MSGFSQKGRASRAALNEAAVRAMRAEDASLKAAGFSGASVKQLADIHGVGRETIRRILRWETWRWVSEEEELMQPPPSKGEKEAAEESLKRLLSMQDKPEEP